MGSVSADILMLVIETAHPRDAQNHSCLCVRCWLSRLRAPVLAIDRTCARDQLASSMMVGGSSSGGCQQRTPPRRNSARRTHIWGHDTAAGETKMALYGAHMQGRDGGGDGSRTAGSSCNEATDMSLTGMNDDDAAHAHIWGVHDDHGHGRRSC